MVGDLIAGRYELNELVGSGGMSNVFRAYDRLLERTVAIKVLHEQFGLDGDYVERFRREARSVAQLAHPNIVTVIDRGEEDGRQYIVFEYIDGENLKAVVGGRGLPVDQAVGLTLQVARALEFAHKRGLVHRDVKPQNVLLNDEGQAKVTDFGIARSLDVQGVTQTGTVLGTSDYIAPEQARGHQVDQKTDIYSLGAVLYELLTGEVPYQGDNFVAVAMQHVNAPVPSVLEKRPDCPVRLEHVVQCAMEKDPADRFDSMSELVAELEACQAELGMRGDEGATMIIRRPRRERPRRPRPRLPLVPILLGLLAAAAIAGGVYAYFSSTDDDPAAEPAPRPTRVEAIAAYDPEGGDGEHDAEAARATDGNPSTYWTTEDYRQFSKDGVGLILDAGRPVKLGKLMLTTDDPGFVARIKASSDSGGGFQNVSEEKSVDGGTASFDVDTGGQAYQFYLVWLRLPESGGRAHINEVRAS